METVRTVREEVNLVPTVTHQDPNWLLLVRYELFQNKRNAAVFIKLLSCQQRSFISLWHYHMVSAQVPTSVQRGTSEVKVE
jgi:hypothetical protein